MDFLFFGIQGSGKGTQGKILCERFGLAYFETGGFLRKLASENSNLGKKIKSILEAGRLVPNEVVMEIVENFLEKLSPKETPVIFDGIPRNEEQASLLEKLLTKHGRKFIGVLIDLPRNIAEGRLLKRRMCEKCKKVFPTNYTRFECDVCDGKLTVRSDDNANAIKTRFDVYEKETMPIIDRYRREKKLLESDGNLTIEQSNDSLTKLLQPFIPK